MIAVGRDQAPLLGIYLPAQSSQQVVLLGYPSYILSGDRACYNLRGVWGMPRWGASILGHAPSKAIPAGKCFPPPLWPDEASFHGFPTSLKDVAPFFREEIQNSVLLSMRFTLEDFRSRSSKQWPLNFTQFSPHQFASDCLTESG